MCKEKISVIMSTYNEPEEWVRKSIESILNQSYRNLELIVVCDNPENVQLINILNEYNQKDSRVKLILNEVNLGLSKSLNRALEKVTGKYVARMDSDDIAIENRIELQIKYLKEKKLDLIGSGVVCIDESGKKISNMNSFPKSDKEVRKKIIHNNCLAHPTWVGRVEVFKDNKGYREIPYAEDYDFILRALDKGYKLGNINSILLKYRIRSSSISNKNGLKQFLISQELVNKFKDGLINRDISYILEEIDKVISRINNKEEEEYYIASTSFTRAAMKLKSLNPIGIKPLLNAIFISKYYRKKIKCYINGLM